MMASNLSTLYFAHGPRAGAIIAAPGGLSAERKAHRGNCLTDQTPRTLPSTRELAASMETLKAVCSSLVHLQWQVRRIARGGLVEDDSTLALVEGDEIPTFAHIGELYVFVLDARARLREAENYVQTIEKGLEDLDTARLVHAIDKGSSETAV